MDKLFKQRMKKLLQDDYENFEKALLQKPVKSFYLNPLKKDVISHLEQRFLTPHPYIKNAYFFDYDNYPVGKHPYFNCGLYYIQEPSAMAVANCVDFKEDDYVLDMCAAPGGKTCFTANQLSDQGLMIANDINKLRAGILSENIERFGIKNTIVTNCDPVKLEKHFNNFFDKIILDAPCSGEGMFRKLDQAIKTWSIDKINECAYIQRKLIDSAYKMLKNDGILIYSTCTYSLEENEEQVDYMVKQLNMELLAIKKQPGMTSGYQNDKVVRMYPHLNKGEGQFIALLKKHDEESKIGKIKLLKPNINKEQLDLINKFYLDNLKVKIPPLLYNSNNHIYAILPQFPELKGIRVLRTGLYLGECKKRRFEPSHSLALTLTKNDVKRYYDYKADDKEITKYLHGETLLGTNQKGYGLILVDGYPLSFYKESNNQIKNLYPKGLRR
ncbi:RsmF rRNA methyltransferase first C-terminal domain-containing protein [Thomasclavelia saccharogumia]|uniref:RsmF rRNA methyltransferase first C-terminal domain-containing protein n=1 Tax=Thomasclavelia saccharogumia TaxID=341225 RepID=UPI00047A3940|nr:RsmF rRNA methyltransferase first C-terminal domain-containing protein [Thomasclavelia saccharogumia]